MIRQISGLLIFGMTWCALLSLGAEEQARVFEDARAAIAAARQHNKMIVFFLANRSEKSHAGLEEALTEELDRQAGEFILVRSNPARPADRELYTGRFGKKLEKLPLAVVSNSGGEALASTEGEAITNYQKMLVEATIKSGKITDPLALAALRDKLKSIEERAEGKSAGIFAPIMEDLKLKKNVLSPLREWTLKDGSKVKAHLLEALGDSGHFINDQGETIKISFAKLSDDDIAYLKTILRAAP